MRKTHDAGLKVKVALEAIKGEKTVAEISSKYGIHPNQVGKWEKEVLERLRGREQMTDWLSSIGHHVNPKRVRRFMQEIGIQAIHPRRRTSVPNKEHKVFPYLLREMRIEYPNQVWATVQKLRYIGNTSLVLEKISDISKIDQKGGGV